MTWESGFLSPFGELHSKTSVGFPYMPEIRAVATAEEKDNMYYYDEVTVLTRSRPERQ